MTSAGETPRDDGAEGDARIAAAMFSPQGRADPRHAWQQAEVSGKRYAVARDMLREPSLAAGAPGQATEPMWRMFRRWLVRLDDDRHRQMRARFTGIFAPRRVEAYRATIVSRTDALLDRIEPEGSAELVQDFALPLPFSIVSDVVGLPEEMRGWYRERHQALMQSFARQREPGSLQQGNAAAEELQAAVVALLDERARVPADDLLTLLAANLSDDPEERADVVANVVFFHGAGFETTASMLSGGILLLVEHPEIFARVRDDDAVVPSAVEEILRLVTPLAQIPRTPCDERVIAGHRFAAGVRRMAWLGAANRDPEIFAQPDVFDIDRADGRHLAFGMGPHFCLGAALARLHGEVALPALLKRLDGLRLDGSPRWGSSMPLRELEHLPLAWDVRSPVRRQRGHRQSRRADSNR